MDNKNIQIDNCVLWCDWGKCCEVGVETTCREYENISFKNCDILRCGKAALDINNGDCAEIHDVTFENINAEFNAFDTMEVYQSKDEDIYTAQDTVAEPFLIWFGNRPWRTPSCMKAWGLPPLTDELDLTGIKQRNIHDVKIKNIHVYYDEKLLLNGAEPDIKCSVYASPGTDAFYNISISDISVNGKKILLS